jgi:hypothetical protein
MSQTIFTATFNSTSPYREPITEVLQLLEDAKIITPENKQQAIDLALNFLDDNSDIIAIIWCADDVLEIATQKGLNLSQEDCLEVLQSLKSNHDSELGISWNSLHFALDYFVSNHSRSRSL